MSHPERSRRDTVCIPQILILVVSYDIFITWMTIYSEFKCCFHITNELIISALNFTISTNIETPVACFFVNSKSTVIFWSNTPLLEFSHWQQGIPPFTEYWTSSYCWFFSLYKIRYFSRIAYHAKTLIWLDIMTRTMIFKNMFCNGLLHI